MKTHNSLLWALLAVVPPLSLLCTGGSTEIGNARSVITGSIVDHGKNVDSVQVQLVAEDYIPGKAIADKVFSTLTSCKGSYRFEDVPKGTYYLNARGSGKMLLRGPIPIEKPEEDLATDELKETSRLTMCIPENSTVNVIYVQGTTHSWRIESDTAILDSVPSGAITVVAFTQSGIAPENLTPDNSLQITVDLKPAETAVSALDNAPPIIISTEQELTRTVVRTDGYYSTTLRVSDPEGDECSFSLVSGPAGMTIDGRSGLVKWIFADTAVVGDYGVGVRVTDAQGASRTMHWTVTVVQERFILSSFAQSAAGYAGRPYLFQTDTSIVTDANACRYSWGDGDTSAWVAFSGVAHAWKSTGNFVVKFQVQHTSDGSLSPWSVPWTMEITVPYGYDTIPPIITIGDDTVYVQLGQPYIDPGFAAWDAYDGNLTTKIVKSGTVNINKLGVYKLTYTVTDATGNSVSVIRIVFVVEVPVEPDTIRPVITLVGPDTIVLLDTLPSDLIVETFKESGYMVEGNVVGDDSINKVVISFDTSADGICRITYNVTDMAGNKAVTVDRWIFTEGISSSTGTIIDLAASDTLIRLPASNGKWVEPGYRASSAFEGDITSKVVVDSSDLIMHLKQPGTYYVLYSVPIGETIIVRKIRAVEVFQDTIVEPSPPVITLKGRNPDTVVFYPINSDTGYNDPGATALDVKDGDITDRIIITGYVNMGAIGKYTLNYSVTDLEGYTVRAVRIVWVVRDTSGVDLLVRYGVPSKNAIPNLLGKTYKNMMLDGDGPDLDTLGGMFIYWSLVYDTLNTLFLMFSNDTINITSNTNQTFSSPYPAMTLMSTGIPGLDGEYYVAVSSNEMYWVEKNGRFAIIWSE